MVDIYVGAERKKYHLHRDLLCERSEFFKASFMRSFKEAATEEMALPEDDVVSFELFVGWLYGGSLISISSDDELPAFVNLVILAQKLCLEQLQNKTMDRILIIYRTSSRKVAAQTIRSIYENTSASDQLRSLIIRCASWTAVSNETSSFAPDDKDLIKRGGEFAIDFTSMLARHFIHTKAILNVSGRLTPEESQIASITSTSPHQFAATCLTEAISPGWKARPTAFKRQSIVQSPAITKDTRCVDGEG